MLDNAHVDLVKARLYVNDAKSDAGVRSVDIHPRLLDEPTSYRANRASTASDQPTFPTQRGTLRNKNNERQRIIEPVVARANLRRAQLGSRRSALT